MKEKFYIDDYDHQKNSKKAKKNRKVTLNLINKYLGGLFGTVLDVGKRNYFTKLLEGKYWINLIDHKIDSTEGDLDLVFNCPRKDYNFVHYNNVIEHQYNPLFTLLEIKKRMRLNGILILGTPLKPNWMTFSSCHFHEFNKYQYYSLLDRAGFVEVAKTHYCHEFGLGIRKLIGGFYNRQVVSILKVKADIEQRE